MLNSETLDKILSNIRPLYLLLPQRRSVLSTHFQCSSNISISGQEKNPSRFSSRYLVFMEKTWWPCKTFTLSSLLRALGLRSLLPKTPSFFKIPKNSVAAHFTADATWALCQLTSQQSRRPQLHGHVWDLARKLHGWDYHVIAFLVTNKY